MPLICPHCGIAQADGNKTCINCGQPLVPTPAAPPVDPASLAEADTAAHLADPDDPVVPDSVRTVQAGRNSWRLPALIAVSLLLALVAFALLATRHKLAHPVSSQAQAFQPPVVPLPMAPSLSRSVPALPILATPLPAAVLLPPEIKAAAKMSVKMALETVPLKVSLASVSAGRHIEVGTPVPLTAYTTSAHGQSATLTLFSRRGRGQKTMLAFVVGSLCSTTWTPVAPGPYVFTATAHDDHRQASSDHIEITVDKPAPLPASQDTLAQTPPIIAAPLAARSMRQRSPRTASARAASARAASARAASVRAASARAASVRAASVRAASVRAVQVKTAPPAARPAPAITYHVAAARFPFSRNATILADALNRRGYHAVPERMADAHGKAIYAVVIGSYRRPREARAAALALQRSGYPAYLFGGH